MNQRLSTLCSMLPDNADSAMIISNENRKYFTDFVSSAGYLLVTRKEAFLLVDFRYEEAAQRKARGCTVIAYKKLSDTICELITGNNIKSIMLEGSAFTLNQADQFEKMIEGTNAQAIRSADLDKLISRMRIIKTASEVDKIRQAQKITEQALGETLRLIKEGVSEKDVELELEFRMRRGGADGVSFDLIVLTGKNTSMPHGVPGADKIKAGDFILFDIGAVVDGYHSDMTRTVVLGGADDKQKRVYDTVLQAQSRALDAVRQGVSCGEVDRAARSYIYEAGFEGRFGHSTGHGVGLEIHESPAVGPGSDFILQNGMVITVEPGIYLPDEYGVRIEDMVVVTNEGCIDLTTMPKELITL